MTGAFTFTWHDKDDVPVLEAKQLIQVTVPLSSVLLFGGDRWRPVMRVALAFCDETLVGLASLAPHDEDNNPQAAPTIVGVWVLPAFRGHSVGLQLLQACVQEAQERYSAERVSIEGVSPAGLSLALKAQEQGLPLNVTGMGLTLLP